MEPRISCYTGFSLWFQLPRVKVVFWACWFSVCKWGFWSSFLLFLLLGLCNLVITCVKGGWSSLSVALNGRGLSIFILFFCTVVYMTRNICWPRALGSEWKCRWATTVLVTHAWHLIYKELSMIKKIDQRKPPTKNTVLVKVKDKATKWRNMSTIERLGLDEDEEEKPGCHRTPHLSIHLHGFSFCSAHNHTVLCCHGR